MSSLRNSRFWIALFCVVLTVLGGVDARDKKKKKQKAASLGGVVMNAASNQNTTGYGYDGVTGAEVTIVELEGMAAKTDNRGYFFFEKVIPGEYTVQVQAEGFETQTQSVRVTMNNVTNALTFQMLPAGMNRTGNTFSGPGTLYVAFAQRRSNRAVGAQSDPMASRNLHTYHAAIAAGVNPMTYDSNAIVPTTGGKDMLKLKNPTTTSENTLMIVPPNNFTLTGYHDVTSSPYWLTFDKEGKTLYVATASRQIQVLDVSNKNHLLRSLPVADGFPTEVKLSSDGNYVMVSVMSGSNPGVMLINTKTYEAQAFIPVASQPSQPRAVTMSPRGDRLYVVCGHAQGGEVHAIDVYTGQTVAKAPTGANPMGTTLSQDGRYLYVVNAGAGSVSIYDAWSLVQAGEIRVGVSPHKIAATPDGTRLFVTNKGSNTVSVIDATSHGVVATTRTGKGPLDVVCTLDGKAVFVSCNLDGTVYKLNSDSGAVEHVTEPLPKASPYGVAIRP